MDVKYKEYIKSAAWKRKRDEVFEERGRECEQCSNRYYLHVHHLNYERLGNELMGDLQILCYQCHMSKHDKYFDKYVLKTKNIKIKGSVLINRDNIKKVRGRGGQFSEIALRILKLPYNATRINVNKLINSKAKVSKDDYALMLANKNNIKGLRPPSGFSRKTLCRRLKEKGIMSIGGYSLYSADIEKLKTTWSNLK